MTDTGQVPSEGQPESAGMVEQPGVTAHGAYTYLSEAPAEDEDLLLPGAQGAWGNEVPPPAPEPVVETLHEASGHDTGSVDLGGVRLPSAQETSAPRRPLHLGPLIPDASAGPVRSLADRGPEYLDAQPLREMGPQSAAPGARLRRVRPWPRRSSARYRARRRPPRTPPRRRAWRRPDRSPSR